MLKTIRKRLISGSRAIPDSEYAAIWEHCHPAEQLIVGDCPTGADLWVRRFAEFYQRPVEVHVAHWEWWGKKAGRIRNGEMVDRKPDDCVALLLKGAECYGTHNCARQAKEARVPTRKIMIVPGLK